MKIKIIISWILVIVWMILIFFFSNMNSLKSNNNSKNSITTVIETTVNVTNSIGLTDKHPTSNELNKISDQLNYPLRKVMHFFEYFVLSILILNALINSGVNGKNLFVIGITLCIIYSISDEIHQLFIDGRSGKVIDIVIDTIGILLGSLIYKKFVIKYK